MTSKAKKSKKAKAGAAAAAAAGGLPAAGNASTSGPHLSLPLSLEMICYLFSMYLL